MSELKHCAKCGKPMGDDCGVIIYLTINTRIIMHEKCHEIFKDEPLVPLPQSKVHVRITNITIPDEVGNE